MYASTAGAIASGLGSGCHGPPDADVDAKASGGPVVIVVPKGCTGVVLGSMSYTGTSVCVAGTVHPP